MSRKKKRRAETRSTGGYESALLAQFTANAEGGGLAHAGATAALEAASRLVARSMASATVEGPSHLAAAVTPAVLAQMARSLVRAGESIWRIDVRDDGGVRLGLAGHHDTYGGADPETWHYRISEYGPSTTETYYLPADGVVHVRYLSDPLRPWAGIGPLQAAQIAGRLSAEVSNALADEASGPRGAVMPLPTAGDDPSVAELKRDLKALKGRLATVESVRTMHDGGLTSQPQDDWKSRRIGMNPPAAQIDLLERAYVEVLGACGCPPVLFADRGDGTAQRESWRRFMFSTVQPLAVLIAAELGEKLEAEIALSLDALHAADVQGRARAWRSLAGKDAVMDPKIAARLVGLMESDG